MTGTTLVGVDGQASSLRALEWAFVRAQHVGGSVRAVWVLELPAAAVDPKPLVEATDLALASEVEAARKIAPETPVSTEVIIGDPLTELERLSHDADLMVIGTNFRPGIAGRMRGTRAIRIAAEAAVPVVVVPDVDIADREGIVVGYDGSPEAQHALDFAVDEAVRGGQRLTIVEACPYPTNAMTVYASLSPTLDTMVERSREAIEAIADGLRASHPGLVVECVVSVSGPAQLLAEVGGHAAMTVVGSRGRGPVRRWLMGSVSTETLLNLTSPTAVVR